MLLTPNGQRSRRRNNQQTSDTFHNTTGHDVYSNISNIQFIINKPDIGYLLHLLPWMIQIIEKKIEIHFRNFEIIQLFVQGNSRNIQLFVNFSVFQWTLTFQTSNSSLITRYWIPSPPPSMNDSNHWEKNWNSFSKFLNEIIRGVQGNSRKIQLFVNFSVFQWSE